MPNIVNNKVMGDVLLKLENMYDRSLNKASIVRLCAEKWDSIRYNPFSYEVMGSVTHSINTASGYFYRYLLRCYIANSTINGKERYELMPECTEIYSHLGINIGTMQPEVQNKRIDLVFRDTVDDVVYYVEIMKKNNLDIETRKNLIYRYNSVSHNLSNIYPNLKSLLVFVEDSELVLIKGIPVENQMTGAEFFDKFLSFSIEEFFDLHKRCNETIKLDKQFMKCQKIVNDFEKIAKESGSQQATKELLANYKKSTKKHFSF